MHEHQFDSVIFDLDGVITKTASIHCKAWQLMFDEYLKKIYKNRQFKPFDKLNDYLKYNIDNNIQKYYPIHPKYLEFDLLFYKSEINIQFLNYDQNSLLYS